MEKTTQFSIRMPEWIVAELDQMAHAQDRTRAYLINNILRERFGKKVKNAQQKPLKVKNTETCQDKG